MRNLGLLLENWWRTADTAPLQSNIYLYAVGDLDERDAARHAVVFAIKSHGAVETAGGCSFAIARESEFLRLGNAANGEVTLDVKGVWAGLNDFRGFEVIKGDSLTLKKSLPFNLLSFIWLPVLTVPASISMSKAALLTSLDENLMLAFHFSKMPLIETEESTPNLILLSVGVTSYVGTCA